MTVKEILRSAILFSNKPELLALSTFCAESQTLPSVAQQAEIDLFVQCFNFVYKEIASTYFPLLEKEEITFKDNKFYFSDLSKTLISIKKLYKNRKNIKHYVYPDHIYAETDTATIVYASLPKNFALEDEVNLFGGRVLEQVMAYGVAREYAVILGNFSDADVWEARFKTALETSFSGRKVAILPKRRFF
ncbi:MAG: hypothetical protein IKY15_01340 [Clostridia bacterium]|nr:hypothetical protein [Clostridia bacterium]MBR5226926.1 hypothetical protein [Clostridia bacterium]